MGRRNQLDFVERYRISSIGRSRAYRLWKNHRYCLSGDITYDTYITIGESISQEKGDVQTSTTSTSKKAAKFFHVNKHFIL